MIKFIWKKIVVVFKKVNWVAISALATLLLAFLTYQIINNDKGRDELLNRAFIYSDIIITPINKSDGTFDYYLVRILFKNTGKTIASDVNFQIYRKIYKKKDILNQKDEKPKIVKEDIIRYGDINPDQPKVFERKFNKEFFNELAINEDSTFNTEVTYRTYYNKCIKYVQPLSAFNLDKEGGYHEQSVEELNCL